MFLSSSLTYVTRYVGVKKSVLEDSDDWDVTLCRGVNSLGRFGEIQYHNF